jgi:hypothetical protein
LQDWKQEPVFVEDVEIVQGPEGAIPSLVRFYGIHDEVGDCFGGLMYQSAFDGSYKFIPGFSKWESSEVIVTSQPTKNNLVNCNIKRSLEIMEGISNDESNVIGKRLSLLEMKNVISALRVVLNVDSVEIGCLEGQNASVKVRDVLVGPFDL